MPTYMSVMRLYDILTAMCESTVSKSMQVLEQLMKVLCLGMGIWVCYRNNSSVCTYDNGIYKYPKRTSVTVSLVLSSVGEFSKIKD